MDELFGRREHPLGVLGNPHHWILLLRGNPATSLFNFIMTERRTCPVHGELQRNITDCYIQISLRPDISFQESVMEHFLEERDVSCDLKNDGDIKNLPVLIDSCNYPSRTKLIFFSNPEFLVVEYGNGEVSLCDLNILGSEYYLCSLIRLLPNPGGIAHYITYIHHQANGDWFSCDGTGSSVRHVEVQGEQQLQGERNFFFYSKN